MSTAVEMRAVAKSYRGRPVLEDINWSVAAGSIHGLIGANGAGKTTLLRLALGVLWPDRGAIQVLGDTLGMENAELRQTVHYVSSGRALPSGFRVGEWMRYSGLLYDRWDREKADRLLKALELDRDAVIGQLSTGMQLRVKLAVAVAVRPRLLLLDEPTNGLDVVMKRQILRLIIDMAAAEGTTLVIATHHIEDVERMADALSVLYRGRLLLAGEMESIKSTMHRLQVVVPGAWPEQLASDPAIVRTERRGHVAVLTVEGPVEPVVALLRRAGATLIEPVPMDLSEVFTAVLEKEGYARDALEWKSL